MKRLLLVYYFVLIAILANSQRVVTNGNFETWTTGSYNVPENYPISSNPSTFFRYNTSFNLIKTQDAFHGSFALQLNTTVSPNSDTSFAYMVPIQPNGPPTSWHGGIPYSEMPTGLRGYYKYNLATADSGTLLVAFSKNGINIGTYIYSLGGNKSTYTLFNFTFSPALANTPDSVIFAAISCKFTNGTEQPVATGIGSLFLDSISFAGAASQPALLNGDFENWVSHDVALPTAWYYDGNDQGDGMYRSADAELGSYALELRTYQENDNDGPTARSGQISTSYYDNSCGCERGGFPFANQTDTLTFYYKYSASGNDSAIFNLNLQKNGSNIWGNDIYLKSAASFQYIEIPIESGQAPDTANIRIQSSYYNNTDILFVGSDLLIDNLKFKSESSNSGIVTKQKDKELSVYPNPGSGVLTIRDEGFNLSKMEIYNIEGKLVYSLENIKSQALREIDVTSLQKGIYLLKMFNGNKNQTEKIVIQ